VTNKSPAGVKHENRQKRIGLFGGTFNPVHLGHLRSAEVIREGCLLDHIYFIPAARPPHKEGKALAPAHHRLKMVELAVSDNPFFSVSTVEVEREGKSFAVDTIRHFLSAFQSVSLFFILGVDAFREIHTWRNYAVIPELCNLIVTSRPGVAMPPPNRLIPVALRSAFWYDPATQVHHHGSGHILVSYEIEGLNISASAIREKICNGKSVRYLVPAVVESYVNKNTLYKPRGLSR
jgi:nicotinate-nucleotide adenylyltransferase